MTDFLNIYQLYDIHKRGENGFRKIILLVKDIEEIDNVINNNIFDRTKAEGFIRKHNLSDLEDTDNELAINNDELYAKRILEKLRRKKQAKIILKIKMGVLITWTLIFIKMIKIQKKKKLDLFIHQHPRGGQIDNQS